VPLVLNAISGSSPTGADQLRYYTRAKLSLGFIKSTPDHKLNTETESRCHPLVLFHRVLETFTDFQHSRVHCPRLDTSTRRRQVKIIHGPDSNKSRAVFTQFLDPRR